MRLRRSTAFTMRFEPRTTVDMASMLQGRLDVSRRDGIVASSLLTGRTEPVTEAELQVLFAVPGDRWLERSELGEAVSESVVHSLLAKGLLLTDIEHDTWTALRRNEEHLLGLQWDGFALQYHVTSRWQGVDVASRPSDSSVPQRPAHPQPTPQPAQEPLVPFELPEGVAPPVPFAGAASILSPQPPQPTDSPTTESAEAVAPSAGDRSPQSLMQSLAQELADTSQTHGPAPTHFYSRPDRQSELELPIPSADGPLLDVLQRRRTSRLYDTDRPLSMEHLAHLCHFTYGCQGVAPLAPGVAGLRKTSPSGGALHPIEAYPLVIHVDGVDPGLYHYRVDRHALELLQPLDLDAARQLADRFTSGQTYYASAHVLFVLTARFQRSFWKYRPLQQGLQSRPARCRAPQPNLLPAGHGPGPRGVLHRRRERHGHRGNPRHRRRQRGRRRHLRLWPRPRQRLGFGHANAALSSSAREGLNRRNW